MFGKLLKHYDCRKPIAICTVLRTVKKNCLPKSFILFRNIANSNLI